MIAIKGRKEINLESDNEIYIFQKDFNRQIVQEDEKGEEKIDLTEVFSNLEEWKWGVKNRNYAGVFLNAISFKKPNLTLNVPNVLISISKDNTIFHINAFVFAKDEELAFKYANQFKNENREHIAFELSKEIRKYPIPVPGIDSIYELIDSIQKRLKKIEKNTEEVKETTKEVKINLEELKSVIFKVRDELKDEINVLKGEISKLKNLENENKIKVHLIKEEGIYKEGEKIYLEFIGELFDYLEPDWKELEKRKIYIKDKAKFKSFVKKKFLKKEAVITTSEFEEFGVKTSSYWKIQFKVNDVRISKLLKALSSNSLVPVSDLEKAFKQLISDVVEGKKTEISLKALKDYIKKEHQTRFSTFIHKIERLLQGSVKKDIRGDVYIKSEISDLILFAIGLEAEKKNLKIEINER